MRYQYTLGASIAQLAGSFAAPVSYVAPTNVGFDYTTYVEPFLGTDAGGNMFPGVAVPFGVVKLGPDLYTGSDSYSGYQSSGNITAFTAMHESGTGGAPKYGVVGQMPVVGTISNPLADLSSPRAAKDSASVGYYKSNLQKGNIAVELAATSHAAFYQYTFPAVPEQNSSTTPSIVVDVSHVLPSFRGQGLGQNYVSGQMELFPDGHYEANGTYNNGWNRSPNWTIYSCGRFSSRLASAQTFSGVDSTVSSYSSAKTVSGTDRVGAVFTFDRTSPSSAAVLQSRVGISWISTAKACSYIDSELPTSLSFQDVVNGTKALWNDNVLSKVTTDNTNVTELQMLYSSMYGMNLLPSNRTGENPIWTSTDPYYDDTFTLWDLHRCSTALMQVLQPTAYEEYIRSFINIQQNEGYLPDARSSNFNGRTQGGSNADNVLADAYVKGVRGAVNWTAGYAAMKKDAEVTPVDNFDPMAPDSSTKEGRGALPDWLEYNYITPTFSRAVSRAVEYSLNDFALSQVATGLNIPSDTSLYLNRSRNWRNHWNPNATSLGFSGFVVPRLANGSFVEQNPLECGGCYWADPYYEALPWEYTFGTHHDMAHNIQLSGGDTTFTNKLLTLFKPNQTLNNGNSQFGGTIFNPGNEPSFGSPYLFNFVNRQALSVQTSRFIARSYYSPYTTGLPGNSDAGAMQTWLLWNMFGMYPLTGQTTFLISAPWMNFTMALGNGKTLTVTTTGGNQYTAFYVQSLKVNGQNWTKNWLTFSDVFENGGTMEFVLGANQTAWDTGARPPSPAS